MPKLNEYILIGFCSGYGDGDWRVSMAVQNLSKSQMDELMLTFFHAQRSAWDMWSSAQPKEHEAQVS